MVKDGIPYPKTRNKTKMYALATSIQYCFRDFSREILDNNNKKMTGTLIKMEEVKLSQFKDGMILHIRNPLKLLVVINESSKVRGFKINIQKSTVFLYTNNVLSKENLRKQLHLQLHAKE